MLPLLVVFAMGSGKVFAQAMHFSYDLNTPSYDEPKYPGQKDFTSDRGLTLGFGFYSRPVCADCSATRIGLVIGYQAMAVKPDDYPLYSVNYQAINLQAGLDHRIYGSPRLNMTLGIALGGSFISNNVPCNELFCNTAKAVVLVSPNLKVVLPVFDKVSATIEVRGSILTSDSETTFPFKSGGIIALGFEVHSGPKVKGD